MKERTIVRFVSAQYIMFYAFKMMNAWCSFKYQTVSISINLFCKKKGYHENIIESKFIMQLVFLTPQELEVGEILKKIHCEISHFEFLFLLRLTSKAYWFCYNFPSLFKGKKKKC